METERLMENLEEKREFQRYGVKEGNPAFVAIRPTFLKLGALRDASLSGLGFKYALTGEQEPLSDKEAHIEIDLFVSGNGFYLPNVKCKLAYDRFSEGSSSQFITGLHFRECGLKFHDLTDEQKEQIDVFLRDYTAGSA